MAMNKLKKRMLFGITIAVVLFAIFWSNFMNDWLAQRPADADPVVRVDLFVLYPVVITLVALSIYQLRKNK